MPAINFFTPIAFKASSKSIRSSFLETVDNYFFLGGQKAYVMQGKTKNKQEKVILSAAKSSLLAKIGKVLSYCTLVIPLFALIAKAALRSTHRFKLIDPKQKLEKGINISQETAAKIQELMPKILNGKQDDELEWLSKGNNLVFKLKNHQEIVFKIAKPNHYYQGGKLPTGGSDATNARFENMVKAKQICLTHALSHLVIPHAKKITVNAEGHDYALIVEESLDFEPKESVQKELYHNCSKQLNHAVRELATFIVKTNFNDVTPRNIPILNETNNFQGPRRIALIDLEDMKKRVDGFTGSCNGSCGLLYSVSEEQIDLVIAEAKKHGITIDHADKQRRLRQIEAYKNLKKYHESKGITTGKEPIQVDLNTLGLELDKEGQIKVRTLDEEKKCLVRVTQTVTMRKVAEDVVDEINKLIQEKSDQESVQGKRYICIDTNGDPIYNYQNLGLPDKTFITEKEEKQSWLNRIISALIDKGHLFELDKVNGHGFFIQA